VCPVPENQGVFQCIPGYKRIADVVFDKLGLA